MSQVSSGLFFPSARPGLHHKCPYLQGPLSAATFCTVQLGSIIDSYTLSSPTCFTGTVSLSFGSNAYYALSNLDGRGLLLLCFLNHVLKDFFFLAVAANSASETEFKTLIWYETIKNLYRKMFSSRLLAVKIEASSGSVKWKTQYLGYWKLNPSENGR